MQRLDLAVIHLPFTLALFQLNLWIPDCEHYVPMSTASVSTPTYSIPSPREITTKPRRSDLIFRTVVTAGGFTSLFILGLITFFLGYRGWHILQDSGLHFLTGAKWIAADPDAGTKSNYGIGAMLAGTFVIALIGLIVGAPLAIGVALFLTYYAPEPIKRPLSVIIDIMAAIPSIVYGLWGYFVLMPHAIYWAKLIHKYFSWIPVFEMRDPVFMRSPFVAGLVLSIMIIPIMTSVTREVFAQAPLDRVQAAYALGATKWRMIKAVVFPYGRSGMIGGAMLGLGRAMGETVAVYTVLNISYQYNFQVLFSAGGSVASMIVAKFGEASAVEIDALMAAGFILFAATLLVNLIADKIVSLGKKGR
jgi:phosphate transport system permease protein